MKCPTCEKGAMVQLGCTVNNLPFYWCSACGTVKPCDQEPVAPADAKRLSPSAGGCPICSGTMAKVGERHGDGVFMCERCGTVKVEDDDRIYADIYIPKLVERCRVFEKDVLGHLTGALFDHLKIRWTTTSIAESIHRPEDRK